jgi:hypothetical protein
MRIVFSNWKQKQISTKELLNGPWKLVLKVFFWIIISIITTGKIYTNKKRGKWRFIFESKRNGIIEEN